MQISLYTVWQDGNVRPISEAVMRILVVEDENLTRRFICEFVRPLGAFDTASNGLEAYQKFRVAFDNGQPFGLVFLDLVMPEIGGQEALRAIRAFEADMGIAPQNRVKVIIISGQEDAQNIYNAHMAECSDYLLKPVTKADLTRVLQKLGILQGLVQ